MVVTDEGNAGEGAVMMGGGGGGGGRKSRCRERSPGVRAGKDENREG